MTITTAGRGLGGPRNDRLLGHGGKLGRGQR